MATSVKPRLQELYETKVRSELKDKLGLANVMQIPRVTKVTLNVGIGTATRTLKSWKQQWKSWGKSPANNR